jgi:hypothetical protein
LLVTSSRRADTLRLSSTTDYIGEYCDSSVSVVCRIRLTRSLQTLFEYTYEAVLEGDAVLALGHFFSPLVAWHPTFSSEPLRMRCGSATERTRLPWRVAVEEKLVELSRFNQLLRPDERAAFNDLLEPQRVPIARRAEFKSNQNFPNPQ